MKTPRKLEKRIYELLGIKFFINKILFGLEKIMKKLNIDMKYRLTKFDIEGLKKAREDAVDNGWAYLLA